MVSFGILTAIIYSSSQSDTAQPADAIIVLGAAQHNGIPSPVFQARLNRAYDLFHQEYAPFIILTGGKGQGENIPEAQAGRSYLINKGVKPQALLQEDTGTTTLESLSNITHIAKRQTIQRVILVSDGFHLFRSKKMAHDLGFVAFQAPAIESPIASNTLIKFRYIIREEAVLILYLLFKI